MSACYDCPIYGNPTITAPRRAMCCMEMKQQEPSLEVQLERLEYRAREVEREASQTPSEGMGYELSKASIRHALQAALTAKVLG